MNSQVNKKKKNLITINSQVFVIFGLALLGIMFFSLYSQPIFAQTKSGMKQESGGKDQKNENSQKPTNLTAKRISNNRIDLAWKLSDKSKKVSVILERSLHEINFSDAEVFNLNAGTERFSDTKNLTPAKTYYYRVKTINKKGSSPYSEVVKVVLTNVKYFGGKEPPVQ